MCGACTGGPALAVAERAPTTQTTIDDAVGLLCLRNNDVTSRPLALNSPDSPSRSTGGGGDNLRRETGLMAANSPRALAFRPCGRTRSSV